MAAPMLPKIMARVDANSNGKVTDQELLSVLDDAMVSAPQATLNKIATKLGQAPNAPFEVSVADFKQKVPAIIDDFLPKVQDIAAKYPNGIDEQGLKTEINKAMLAAGKPEEKARIAAESGSAVGMYLIDGIGGNGDSLISQAEFAQFVAELQAV